MGCKRKYTKNQKSVYTKDYNRVAMAGLLMSAESEDWSFFPWFTDANDANLLSVFEGISVMLTVGFWSLKPGF